MDRYSKLNQAMRAALEDLSILSGDTMGPSDATWQDLAGTAAVNLYALANALDSIRKGETHHQGCPWEGPAVFPSPSELMDEIEGTTPEAPSWYGAACPHCGERGGGHAGGRARARARARGKGVDPWRRLCV